MTELRIVLPGNCLGAVFVTFVNFCSKLLKDSHGDAESAGSEKNQ